MKRPPFLKPGDKIGIFAPARKINSNELNFAIKAIENHGYQAFFSKKLFAVDNQFAGTDKKRAAVLQELLDNDDVKAVVSARGGYGSVRIIDEIDFTNFIKKPKWLIGYSDITVFHSHINKNFEIETLHAAMPLGLEKNSAESVEGIFEVLKGSNPAYRFDIHPLNKPGDAKGKLTGGNLSVLYSLLGSNSFPETNGKTLFLEDLDEYLYHIERMMMALKRAGVLKGLAGIIVGGMTDMRDNEIPFGKTAQEIIREAVDEYNYPVCFGFPAGHQSQNLPLIMGSEIILEQKNKATLRFVE
ncbi:MAG TPA: LD-carboxypeptidase [Bacteroidales bacterium]